MEKTWYALIAFVLAWFVAQAWKVVWGLIKGYKSNQPVGLASLIGYVARSGGINIGAYCQPYGYGGMLGIYSWIRFSSIYPWYRRMDDRGV